MADEENAGDRAGQNKRKLEEYLARMRESGKVPPPASGEDGGEGGAGTEEGAPKKPPKPPPRPPGWDAWKRVHGGKMHEIRGEDQQKAAEKADYKLLELKPGASREEVKRNFNRLAKQYHPDLGGDAEIFQAMRAAYNRIMKE
jgi:hypothetical protein